jgi:RNA polymerase sigma-70 factor (ECF subfamily)
MTAKNHSPHLSQITTVWSVLQQAHRGPPKVKAAAQQQLIQRYGGAVYNYLLAALHDAHVAEDLVQEFALCLVRGDFRAVQPERGRFRDYIKTILFHLVGRYRKGQHALPQPLPPDNPVLVNLAAQLEQADDSFHDRWREQLLARAWESLAGEQGRFYTVLRLRATQPDLSSRQLSERLTRQLGKPFSPEAVRQTLHRARERFAVLLVEEVAHSLESPTPEQLEEELRDLNLLGYCQSAVDRLFPSPGRQA